jgi:hypothetical protein
MRAGEEDRWVIRGAVADLDLGSEVAQQLKASKNKSIRGTHTREQPTVAK